MIGDEWNRALATEIDIGLVDHHRDIGMIFEQSGDFRARQGDAGRRVGIGDHDRARLAPIILDPDAHFVVQRHSLAGEAEQLRPHGIKAVGDVRKKQRLRLFQERDECMREHFVRAIANEDLFGLDPVMDGERLAQLLRLRIGIKRRVSTAAARIASSASGEGPNGLSLVLSFTRLAMRGCSPGT
jgi:hypothetical protein